jgi:hypothetical protein
MAHFLRPLSLKSSRSNWVLRLQQEIDNRADTITGQTVVPNIFIIELGSVDHERLAAYFETLSVELGTLADAYSLEQRYTTIDSAHISFDLDTRVGNWRVSYPQHGS